MTCLLSLPTRRAHRLTGAPAHRRTGSRAHPFAVILFVVVALAFAACGNNGAENGEDYGDLLSSPGGLLVLEEEHETGYGRPDCFACHEIRSMHIVNRTSLPNCDQVDDPDEPCIDLADIQSFIRQDKEGSCVVCHGNNGVAP